MSRKYIFHSFPFLLFPSSASFRSFNLPFHFLIPSILRPFKFLHIPIFFLLCRLSFLSRSPSNFLPLSSSFVSLDPHYNTTIPFTHPFLYASIPEWLVCFIFYRDSVIRSARISINSSASSGFISKL